MKEKSIALTVIRKTNQEYKCFREADREKVGYKADAASELHDGSWCCAYCYAWTCILLIIDHCAVLIIRTCIILIIDHGAVFLLGLVFS